MPTHFYCFLAGKLTRCVYQANKKSSSYILSPVQQHMQLVISLDLLHNTYGLQNPVFKRLTVNQEQMSKFSSILLLSFKLDSTYFPFFFFFLKKTSNAALSPTVTCRHIHNIRQKIMETIYKQLCFVH